MAKWKILKRGGKISKMGYRDDSPYRDRPSLDIHTPNGVIDMSQTGLPILANGRYLEPYSGLHQFDTTRVREIPLAQYGYKWAAPQDSSKTVVGDSPNISYTVGGNKNAISVPGGKTNPVQLPELSVTASRSNAPTFRAQVARAESTNPILKRDAPGWGGATLAHDLFVSGTDATRLVGGLLDKGFWQGKNEYKPQFTSEALKIKNRPLAILADLVTPDPMLITGLAKSGAFNLGHLAKELLPNKTGATYVSSHVAYENAHHASQQAAHALEHTPPLESHKRGGRIKRWRIID